MSTEKIEASVKEKLISLAAEIEKQTAALLLNNEAFISKGNKQAGKRARVASLNVSKATKEYRMFSMEASK